MAPICHLSLARSDEGIGSFGHASAAPGRTPRTGSFRYQTYQDLIWSFTPQLPKNAKRPVTGMKGNRVVLIPECVTPAYWPTSEILVHTQRRIRGGFRLWASSACHTTRNLSATGSLAGNRTSKDSSRQTSRTACKKLPVLIEIQTQAIV